MNFRDHVTVGVSDSFLCGSRPLGLKNTHLTQGELWDVVEVGVGMPGHLQGLWTRSVETVSSQMSSCASQCGNWDGKGVSKATRLVAVTGLSPRTLMAHGQVLIGETLLPHPH